MSLEADWSLRLVEFGVRQGNESKRIPVLIGRLVSVFFNDSRIVVSDKFADSSEPAISEENWCVRVDALAGAEGAGDGRGHTDRKSTRLNSSHVAISYAVFCLKKKKKTEA